MAIRLLVFLFKLSVICQADKTKKLKKETYHENEDGKKIGPGRFYSPGG